MITIEVGPGDTAEIIARRHPDVFDWECGTLVKRAGIGDVRVVCAVGHHLDTRHAATPGLHLESDAQKG